MKCLHVGTSEHGLVSVGVMSAPPLKKGHGLNATWAQIAPESPRD